MNTQEKTEMLFSLTEDYIEHMTRLLSSQERSTQELAPLLQHIRSAEKIVLTALKKKRDV